MFFFGFASCHLIRQGPACSTLLAFRRLWQATVWLSLAMLLSAAALACVPLVGLQDSVVGKPKGSRSYRWLRSPFRSNDASPTIRWSPARDQEASWFHPFHFVRADFVHPFFDRWNPGSALVFQMRSRRLPNRTTSVVIGRVRVLARAGLPWFLLPLKSTTFQLFG